MSLIEWNKKKIILFDLDGTLTDPGVGITNSVMYALEKYGITVSDKSELYKFIGPPLMQSFEKYYGFDQNKAERAVALYREYFQDRGIFENEIYDGIQQLLDALKVQGKVIGLATSKPEIYAKQILEHFGLDDYFDFVSGSMLNGERTDKGEVIAWAIQLLGERARYTLEEMVMIGDREHDVIGARKNGLASIGVLFGYGSREELTGAGADVVVSSVCELTEMLTGEAAGEVLG
ncbi:HAD family hydrolase [Frisingicoccus caecimuris]|uniref:Phosphoglycolate phosphatase n=1 Tax=Frisingicoccus caecimuris TaxID=1796636 RepID=A0A4R2LFP7_9FIRM|nr:HAD family hydrolase [Frisingicoccus caecimuris]MCR1918997.1 HAD family hydrolase [Frisingicoccus caecimuris]TCO84774.1 phosphoglycolate phosphatase [Frisingicoccus caecimuris]